MAEQFVWITVADGNICPDCLIIESFQPPEGRTLEDWVSRGLPGSGNAVCGASCRCILIEVAYLEQSELDSTFVYIKSGEIAEAPPAAKNLWELIKAGRLAGFTEAELRAALLGKATTAEMTAALDQLIIGRAGAAAKKAAAEAIG